MTNHSIMALVVVAGAAVLPIQMAHAFDSLPLSDGSYVQSSEDCDALNKGELDFIDFVVAKNGHAYDMPEVGCLVASVKKLRPNRFLVESDCIEGGEAYQQTVIIDRLESGRIRIDGDELMLCGASGIAVSPEAGGPVRAVPPAAPVAVEAVTPGLPDSLDFTPTDLIEQWADADEDCRGGSGNSPDTMVACRARDKHVEMLHKFGWCYGIAGQSRAEYDWHQCTAKSIR